MHLHKFCFYFDFVTELEVIHSRNLSHNQHKFRQIGWTYDAVQRNSDLLQIFQPICNMQSHYVEVAQGGFFSRAIHNWLWIFSLFKIYLFSADAKVCSLLEDSCAIFISFKIVVIFNSITSADIKTKSADVILKMTTILKEMKIGQLCSKSEWTLVWSSLISKKGKSLPCFHHGFAAWLNLFSY